jgi:hypothetical protein
MPIEVIKAIQDHDLLSLVKLLDPEANRSVGLWSTERGQERLTKPRARVARAIQPPCLQIDLPGGRASVSDREVLDDLGTACATAGADADVNPLPEELSGGKLACAAWATAAIFDLRLDPDHRSSLATRFEIAT